jgi:hypothetical protein
LHGLVLGLGVDIAAACNVRYAAETAQFSIKVSAAANRRSWCSETQYGASSCRSLFFTHTDAANSLECSQSGPLTGISCQVHRYSQVKAGGRFIFATQSLSVMPMRWVRSCGKWPRGNARRRMDRKAPRSGHRLPRPLHACWVSTNSSRCALTRPNYELRVPKSQFIRDRCERRMLAQLVVQYTAFDGCEHVSPRG